MLISSDRREEGHIFLIEHIAMKYLYLNPVAYASSISFTLPNSTDVIVEIWNMQGQLQSVVFEGFLQT